MNVLMNNTVVPKDYVGVSTGDIVSTPSSFLHTLVRSWDYRADLGLSNRWAMKNINPSAGVFNFAICDKLLDNNIGKQIIFTLGQPADYLVSRPAVGSAYLGGKANMCPDDLDTWRLVVQTVCVYIKEKKVVGAIWELWNEIDQVASYGDPISSLGPYARITAQTIKEVDPTAIILSPSCAGFSNKAQVEEFLISSDGAGNTGAFWCDGVAFHYYNFALEAYEHPLNQYNATRIMQSMLTLHGIDKPLWVTESGFPSAAPDVGRRVQHRLLVFAALGCKCFLGYKYDNSSFPLYPYTASWNAAAGLLQENAVISSLEIGVGQIKIIIDGIEYIF